MSPGRTAALRARVEAERGRRLDRAFDQAAFRLEPRERAFAHELAYGATRLRGRLDHLLASHVHRGLTSLDAGVLEVLRLGAYQVLYMRGVPAYAAVSQAVDQVRSIAGAGPAGLVNAVLRKVADAGDGPERFPGFEDSPAAFLETWGSHPGWLVERWLARRAPKEVRALVAVDNERPSVHLVPLDVSPGEAVVVLAEAGIGAVPVAEGTHCVRLDPGTDPVAALAALPRSVVQDPAAGLVAVYADVPAGTNVADLCAAPGGKVLVVSESALYTLAFDRSESRLRMVRDNARRTGSRVGLVVADALRPPLSQVDVVLLDAPCTGTGTLARRPDARWRLTPDSVEAMRGLQADMLDSAASVVAEGGILVYSTCSLEPEENAEQVDAFLGRRRDFRVEATGAVPSRYLDGEGRLSVTPQATGFDGAFAARLRRES